jgi:hypothetical protein
MSKKLNGKAKQKARKSSRKSFKIAKTLFQFGAFYKGREVDGFAFAIDTKSEPKNGLVTMLHKQVVKAGKGLIEEFKTGTWDIDGCKEQLADAIESFNVKTYGSTDRPMVHFKGIKVSVDTMPELICIMSDIYALEQVGVIKSDDNNGMMYSYSNF